MVETIHTHIHMSIHTYLRVSHHCMLCVAVLKELCRLGLIRHHELHPIWELQLTRILVHPISGPVRRLLGPSLGICLLLRLRGDELLLQSLVIPWVQLL